VNAFWIRTFKYFTANAIFFNTGFNPMAKDATITYMDVIRSTFTLHRGVETISYLSPYIITTDTSILPFSESSV
jgi:hypothetical protein